MLTYEYFCQSNGQTVEVAHGIRDGIATWGELCERTGRDLGETPATEPVERLMSGGLLGRVGASAPEPMPLPMMGGCCGRPDVCGRHR